jgi:hypothetical protein
MFTVVQQQPVFEVEIRGLALLGKADDLLAGIAAATREAEASLLLMDLMAVVGTLAHHDHAYLGHLLAAHLSHLRRIATVVPHEKITRISESAALERGLVLRVFAGRQQAQAWLLS